VNSKIALSLLALILVASLCANALLIAGTSPQSRVDDLANQVSAAQFHADALETEKRNLQNQISNLTAQVTGLQSQISGLTHSSENFTAENTALQQENAALQLANADLQNQLYREGPRLITKLGATDVQIDHTAYHSNQTRLFIEGVVWNIGAKPAQDSRLHVVLYEGEAIVNDTYIDLGTINALDCVNVHTDVYYYTGDRLTDWKITPEHS
jgi:regulator of replication initiation timing